MSTATLTPTDLSHANAVLRIKEKKAQWWEHVAITVWLLATFVTFPGNEYLLYPLTVIFLGLFIVHWNDMVPVLMKSWIIFLVPIMGVVSFMWAPAPSEAIRTGTFMVLSCLFAIVMTCRLQRRDIVRCLFFAGMFTLVIAAPYYGTFETGGPYPHKNQFAHRMLITMIAAFALMMERREAIILRLIALPVAAVAFLFLLDAESATALIFAIIGVFIMLATAYFWQPMRRVQNLRSMVFVIALILAILGVFAFLTLPVERMLDDFLAMFGKDTSFTGRVVLWEAGERATQIRPWTGLGLEGFWRDSSGAAQTLNELDDKPFGTKLSFHNAYLEIQVHLGLIGLALYVANVVWCVTRSVIGFLRINEIASGFFLVITLNALISTLTESYLFGGFDTYTQFFYMGAVSVIAYNLVHKGKAVPVRISTTETAS